MNYWIAQLKINSNEINLPKVTADSGRLDMIIGLIYTALAAVCIFFIVRGALLFVTHGGEPGMAKTARETVLYALVALAGSTMVFALIQFVMKSVAGGV